MPDTNIDEEPASTILAGAFLVFTNNVINDHKFALGTACTLYALHSITAHAIANFGPLFEIVNHNYYNCTS